MSSPYNDDDLDFDSNALASILLIEVVVNVMCCFFCTGEGLIIFGTIKVAVGIIACTANPSYTLSSISGFLWITVGRKKMKDRNRELNNLRNHINTTESNTTTIVGIQVVDPNIDVNEIPIQLVDATNIVDGTLVHENEEVDYNHQENSAIATIHPPKRKTNQGYEAVLSYAVDINLNDEDENYRKDHDPESLQFSRHSRTSVAVSTATEETTVQLSHPRTQLDQDVIDTIELSTNYLDRTLISKRENELFEDTRKKQDIEKNLNDCKKMKWQQNTIHHGLSLFDKYNEEDKYLYKDDANDKE